MTSFLTIFVINRHSYILNKNSLSVIYINLRCMINAIKQLLRYFKCTKLHLKYYYFKNLYSFYFAFKFNIIIQYYPFKL